MKRKPRPLEVQVSSAPNPDIEGSGYWPGSIPQREHWAAVADLRAASEYCRGAIDGAGLGGGNWTGGTIRDRKTKAIVGRVSYNGRVWPPGPWHKDMVPLYEPH